MDALERRIEQIEARAGTATTGSRGRPEPGDQDDRTTTTRHAPPGGPDPEVFWALEGLRSRLAAHADGADTGGVLLTGTVTLPSGEHAEWQEAFTTATLLDADWTTAADTLTALGHPIRLRLLHEVLRGLRTTAELTAVEDLGTTGQLYHHLRQLVAAGWLRTAGRGRYEVPAPRIIPLLAIIGGTQP